MLPTVSETQVQMNIYQKVFLWMIYSQQNQAGLTRYLRHWHSDSLHGTSTKAPECLSLILKQSFSTAVKGDTAGQLFQNSPQAWEKPQHLLCPASKIRLLISQEGWLFLGTMPWLRIWTVWLWLWWLQNRKSTWVNSPDLLSPRHSWAEIQILCPHS